MALRPKPPQRRDQQLASRADAQQEVFVREVDEALREEELRAAAKRYGRLALVALGAGLLGLAGWLWYREHQASVAGEAGEKFTVALDQLEAGRLAAADQALAPLASEGPDGTQIAARLMRAGLALQQGRAAEAAGIYAEVAADQDAPAPYRDLARIREVAVRFESMPPEQAIARLKPLAAPGNPWFGSAGELLGAAYLKQGRADLAGPLFAAIAKDPTVPETVRGRARQLAGLLGVDAVVDVVEAARVGPAAPAADPAS